MAAAMIESASLRTVRSVPPAGQLIEQAARARQALAALSAEPAESAPAAVGASWGARLRAIDQVLAGYGLPSAPAKAPCASAGSLFDPLA